MTDIPIRFYGGPVDGQTLMIPERLPHQWKVVIPPKITAATYAYSDDPPEFVPLECALYVLRAIVNVETRTVEEHYYKFVETEGRAK